MSKKNISQEKIIQAFLASAFEKSAGATSLSDVAEVLEIKKASLYNHFENRDAMYDATLEYCYKEIISISFLSDKVFDVVEKNKTAPSVLFKKLISRYFNLYENEPLFQMYTFVQSEKYFNLRAFEIVTAQNEKIFSDIKKIFAAYQKSGKLKEMTEKEIQDCSNLVGEVILQNLDMYIANRKEIVRQNPECGAGSLFALPTDNESLNKAVKTVECFIKSIINN